MLSWQILSLGCLVLHLMTSIVMGFEAFGSLGRRWTVVKGRRSGVRGGRQGFRCFASVALVSACWYVLHAGACATRPC